MSQSIKFIKVDPEAVVPKKAFPTDIGYDLTIIKEIGIVGNTYFYDTGIQIQPPEGYYFEIFPRSSISKSDFMLANSIGLIDPHYRGNYIIALRNVGDNNGFINFPKLPCKIGQLVLRPIPPNFEFIECNTLDETERGSGSFGSTGQ